MGSLKGWLFRRRTLLYLFLFLVVAILVTAVVCTMFNASARPVLHSSVGKDSIGECGLRESRTDSSPNMPDSTGKPHEKDAHSSELGDLANDLPVPGFEDQDTGDLVALERARHTVSQLKAESLEDSLNNLDVADDYYYPGYYSASFVEKPFDSVQRLLSNRRIIKVYAELSGLSEEAQSAILDREIGAYLGQYVKILDSFRRDRAVLDSTAFEDMSRITEVPDKGPTFHGTRHALQSLVLIASLLGNERSWPMVKKALQYPRFGLNIDERLYDEGALQSLKTQFQPVFPDGLRAQVVYLMATRTRQDTTKLEIDRAQVAKVVEDKMTAKLAVPDFRSLVTQYDPHHRLGRLPVDESHGTFEFRLLVTDSPEIIRQLLISLD